MRVVVLDHPADFDGWRRAARALAAAGTPAAEVTWEIARGDQADLLTAISLPAPEGGAAFSVPRRFIELAEAVICHRDPARFGLLYQALLRLRDQPKLVEDRADPLIDRLEGMERSVKRDIHKMRAFVRFREVSDGPPTTESSVGTDGEAAGPPAEDGERFAAWFEPEHHIVRRNADFFARRFTNMRWSILTPDLCVHWDGEALDFTPGATRADAPDGDDLEATWRTYYASIFNPARLKVKAMTKEMPKKYWRNLPETSLVPSLIAGAGTRTDAMIEKARPMARDDRSDDLPVSYDSLAKARGAAEACTRCPLYRDASQMVFGEGPADARLMFVGEQPGDQEDRAGRPFVGPAGKMLDRALAEAGIERAETYVTNAVKHFKFVPRGTRRIHQKPDAGEIDACRFWVDHERALVKPRLTVALGATAARSLLGKTVTIGKTRGQPIELADGSECWVTIHPSFLLRIEDQEASDIEYHRFVDDLRRIKARLAELS